jgi:protein-tyrosine phosphatase
MPKPYLSQDLPKKFPEDIECIIKSKDPDAGSLYISNVEAAENPMTLKSNPRPTSEYKIGAVLSCAKGYELKHPPHVVPHYKYIPTVDHEECDISIHFDEAVDFITSKLQKTNVSISTM